MDALGAYTAVSQNWGCFNTILKTSIVTYDSCLHVQFVQQFPDGASLPPPLDQVGHARVGFPRFNFSNADLRFLTWSGTFSQGHTGTIGNFPAPQVSPLEGGPVVLFDVAGNNTNTAMVISPLNHFKKVAHTMARAVKPEKLRQCAAATPHADKASGKLIKKRLNFSALRCCEACHALDGCSAWVREPGVATDCFLCEGVTAIKPTTHNREIGLIQPKTKGAALGHVFGITSHVLQYPPGLNLTMLLTVPPLAVPPLTAQPPLSGSITGSARGVHDANATLNNTGAGKLSRGVHAALHAWGELMRGKYMPSSGRHRAADLQLNFLGYYTDNGAFYNYNKRVTNETKWVLPETALRAAGNILAEKQVPIRYLMLDDWWYDCDCTPKPM
jgi:hypothetical protein